VLFYFFLRIHDVYVACFPVTTPHAVDNSGCLELLRSVTLNPVEESVMIFSVELVGTLAEIPGLFTQNSELLKELLCHIQELINAEDPSLGTPFFNTLKMVLKHESEHTANLLVNCEGTYINSIVIYLDS